MDEESSGLRRGRRLDSSLTSSPAQLGQSTGLGSPVQGSSLERLLLQAGAVLVFLLYALLVTSTYATCLEGAEPSWGDTAPNYYRVLTDAQLLSSTGRKEGYDHQIFAGYKHGAIDTNSHGVSLVIRQLGRAASLPRAFGLLAVFSLLVVPLGIGAISSRLGRFGRSRLLRASVVVVFYVGLFCLDGLSSGFLRYGMTAWPLATLVVLALSLSLARLLEAPTPLCVFSTLALLPLLAAHVLAPLALAFCCLLIAVVHLCCGGRPQGLLWLVGAGVAGFVVNAWWVVPLLGELGGSPGTAEALVATPLDLLRDLASVFAPRWAASRGFCGLRWSLLALGAYGWWSLRQREPRIAPTGLTLLIGTLLWSYSGFTPALAGLQPYRNQLLAWAWAALAWPAGLVALRAACRRGWAGRISGLVLVASAVPSIAVGLNSLRTEGLTTKKPGSSEELVLARTLELSPGRGRLLAEGQWLDRLDVNLAIQGQVSCLTFTSPEIVGPAGRACWRSGFPQFFGRDPASLEGPDVHAVLQRYAVAWVLVRSEGGQALMEKLEPRYFSRVERLGDSRLYTLARPSGWFLSGSGRLDLSPGRIELSELSGPVTIRFHFVEGLQAAESGVELSPEPSGGALPFLRIDPGSREAVSVQWSPER